MRQVVGHGRIYFKKIPELYCDILTLEISGKFQGNLKKIPGKYHGNFREVWKKSLEIFMEITGIFQGTHERISGKSQGSLREISWNSSGNTKEILKNSSCKRFMPHASWFMLFIYSWNSLISLSLSFFLSFLSGFKPSHGQIAFTH